jgi:hypothetical protein
MIRKHGLGEVIGEPEQPTEPPPSEPEPEEDDESR